MFSCDGDLAFRLLREQSPYTVMDAAEINAQVLLLAFAAGFV